MIKEGAKYLCQNGTIITLKGNGIGAFFNSFTATKVVTPTDDTYDSNTFHSNNLIWDQNGKCVNDWTAGYDIIGEC